MKMPGIVPWFFVPKNGVKMGGEAFTILLTIPENGFSS